MPTAPTGPSANSAGAGNLFLEADPVPRSEPGAPSHARTLRQRRPGRRLVVALDPPARPAIDRRDASRFTRPDRGIGCLCARGHARLHAADARAGALLRRLATRPYAPLIAAAALAATLLALTWLALAVRNASTARDAAVHARIASTAALHRHQARIAELTDQLAAARTNGRRDQQATAAATASRRTRALTARRRLAADSRRPRQRPRRSRSHQQ